MKKLFFVIVVWFFSFYSFSECVGGKAEQCKSEIKRLQIDIDSKKRELNTALEEREISVEVFKRNADNMESAKFTFSLNGLIEFPEAKQSTTTQATRIKNRCLNWHDSLLRAIEKDEIFHKVFYQHKDLEKQLDNLQQGCGHCVNKNKGSS